MARKVRNSLSGTSRTTAIVMKEKEVRPGNNVNRVATTGPLSSKPAEQFGGAVTALRVIRILSWIGRELAPFLSSRDHMH
jgi:hypothetical protein